MSIEDKHTEVLRRFRECKPILTSNDSRVIQSLLYEFDEFEAAGEDDEVLEEVLEQITIVLDDAGAT